VDAPLTPAEALVAVAYCAAYADGSMDMEESEELSEQLAECHALRSLDEDGLRAAMMRADEIARKQGEAALLARAASALPAQLRPTAFYLAVDLVAADDELAGEERGFLRTLGQKLGVPDPLAAQIVEVVAIRRRA